MVKCNRERFKDFTSTFTVTSEIYNEETCEQNLSNADMIDFRTEMDNLSFYEKTEWNLCEDLIYVSNEEALWQCIVGEIKTPKGALSNSIGQSGYGCDIWKNIGENLDSLTISEIENDVIITCNKYPEVNNVIGIDTYVNNGKKGGPIKNIYYDEDRGTYVVAYENDDYADYSKNNMLLMLITLDTIYGVFDGTLRIPTAHISSNDWVSANKRFIH